MTLKDFCNVLTNYEDIRVFRVFSTNNCTLVNAQGWKQISEEIDPYKNFKINEIDIDFDNSSIYIIIDMKW